ncbi:hypothetical protein AB0P00_17050 [Microbacterium sp. NPDC077057]|uniref:hypothetical protein n=1 Tax=Microbacterium sp. NPDC077057 TaxID=3154763 RepID=UPI00342E657B
MAIKRPKRKQYESEPEFLLACLRYLDAKYPGREGERKRLTVWQRWEGEREPDALRARIRDLVELDDWTDAEAAEFDRLAAAWRNRARSVRPTTDTTERNAS